ncbi:MAG: YeeE/YedE family protein [Gemmatimonadaceae bacterium]|nr:YeeE/YedE family protein [Gemmatimonadaceae bacterium]
MKLASTLTVLCCGALFGFGLALSAMIRPEVVLSFLEWQDFGLMLVLGGAAGVALVAYQLLPRLMRKPVLAERFGVHPSVLDRDTIVGAAIFGAGWGLSGVCPGPAIASLGAGNWPVLWALGGIALGAWVHGLQKSR